MWSPIYLKYKSTINKQPMTNNTLFISQLREKYPFITKHMDKIDPIEKLHLKFLIHQVYILKLLIWPSMDNLVVIQL